MDSFMVLARFWTSLSVMLKLSNITFPYTRTLNIWQIIWGMPDWHNDKHRSKVLLVMLIININMWLASESSCQIPSRHHTALIYNLLSCNSLGIELTSKTLILDLDLDILELYWVEKIEQTYRNVIYYFLQLFFFTFKLFFLIISTFS